MKKKPRCWREEERGREMRIAIRKEFRLRKVRESVRVFLEGVSENLPHGDGRRLLKKEKGTHAKEGGGGWGRVKEGVQEKREKKSEILQKKKKSATLSHPTTRIE